MNKLLVNLLAKENITVQVGNYKTAYFVPSTRTLGLPLWSSDSKYLNDLLVGHEVGHALYTPTQGWHDAKEDVPGIPRSFINIIEDIRIEKLVIRAYPGLIVCFKRGYMELIERNFFGLDGKDVNTLHFIDRLNIKAKARDLMTVNFSAEEQPLLNAAMAVETWEDTLNVCRMLSDYADELKANANDQPDNQPNGQGEDSEFDEMTSESDLTENPEGTGDSEDEQSSGDSDENESSGAESEDEQSSGESKEETEETEETRAKNNKAGGPAEEQAKNPPAPFTDDAFRKNEEAGKMNDSNNLPVYYMKAVTKKTANVIIRGYKEIIKTRADYRAEESRQSRFFTVLNDHLKTESDEFNKTTKIAVSLLMKEFDLKKHAFQFSRATTATKGVLDVNKIHSYKYDDNIFKAVTSLADAKSHGMVMFIDFSGSMGNFIGDVIKQTLILASFCKRAQIPFDVYSFTSTSSRYDSAQNDRIDAVMQDQEIASRGTTIRQLLSSEMTKQEYLGAYTFLLEMAIDGVYGRHTQNNNPRSDYQLGGTPLVESIMTSRHILRKFKATHNIQKVTAIFLTDGDGASTQHNIDRSVIEHRVANPGVSYGINYDSYQVEVDGKIYKYQDRMQMYTMLQSDMLKHLQSEFNVIGYFIAANKRCMQSKLYSAKDRGAKEDYKMEALGKEFNKNKFISVDDALGYDRLFIINSSGIDTERKEFEVAEDATPNQIRNAFKKHSVGKKTKRLFAAEFVDMVA
jgi:hypothetical protein